MVKAELGAFIESAAIAARAGADHRPGPAFRISTSRIPQQSPSPAPTEPYSMIRATNRPPGLAGELMIDRNEEMKSREP